jgi:hypothetical protein
MTTARTPSIIANVALINSTLVKTSACALLKLWGWNSDEENGVFIQIHDKSAAVILADVPYIVVPVPALGTFSFDFSERPWEFFNGCRIEWSTTGPTYTAPAAPIGWVTGEALI